MPGGTNRAAILTPTIVLIPLATNAVYVFLQYQDTRDYVSSDAVDVDVRREWGIIAIGFVLIAVGIEGIVRAALGFGAIFETPSFFWGLTVIAAGTSLPDAFVSVHAAQQDEDVTSLTNVLGSDTFNLLVAIPVGVLLAGSATINFLVAIPLMGFFTFVTIVFLVFIRTSLKLTDLEAATHVALYVFFLAWMGLESTGVIETFPGI